MAEPLKNFFDKRLVDRIASNLQAVHPAFDAPAFTKLAVRDLARMELMPRARHISTALHEILPRDYAEAAGVIEASLAAPASTEGGAMASFYYLPFTEFVAAYGLHDRTTSFKLLYELTKRFTAEFAIRPFLEEHTEETLSVLRVWSRDPHPHVRRLVSEGTRLRLPWAPRLRIFESDPQPIVELLEVLKDDPELYVRRSVANNLNDIMKSHPALALDVCRCWQEDCTPERSWVIAHALRYAVKHGDTRALALLGHGAKARVGIADLRVTPRRARVGGAVEIAFQVRSTARTAQELMIDLRVHYAKKDGGTRLKVFKLSRVTLPAGNAVALRKRLSLQQLTTRKHYPGRHRVEALINGAAFELGHFHVIS